MLAVTGLLLMILGVTCGDGFYKCDGRQNGAQCYGALGGTLDVQLVDGDSDLWFHWSNKTGVVLELDKGDIVGNVFQERSTFTPSTGIFRIHNLSRADDGEYKLEVVNSAGGISRSSALLTIEAPVSSVLVVSECLSRGELRLSCSSEGADSPQYNWILNGDMLTDDQLLSGNHESNKITLKQGVSGKLVCSVRNHVSNISKEETISTCVPYLLIRGPYTAVAILIIIGIVVFFTCEERKTKNEMSEGCTVPSEVKYQGNSVAVVDMVNPVCEL